MPLVVVGTSAAQLTATPSNPKGHIQLVADGANTGTIFIAARSNVTTGGTAATAGLPLSAGDKLLWPSYSQGDASQIYAIASAAAQNLYYEVVSGPV